jgi:nucleotide-binding universal stress UspA family protein
MPWEEAAVETSSAASNNRILVPLDGSERAEAALPYAGAIGGPDADVIVLEVVPQATNVRNVFGTEIASQDRVQQGYEQVAREHLERAAATLGERSVTREVATGDPAEQILRVAEKHAANLIVMTSQGRGAWGPWALGNIVGRVVQSAGLPVLVVQPLGTNVTATSSLPIGGLLVPTDGSEAAARSLPVAARLARTLGIPVRVIRAITSEAPGSTLSDVDENEVRTAQRSEAQRTVDDAAEQLRSTGVQATGEVLTGEPAATIVSAANSDDVVVMASQGEGGRWELGGVADKLLRNATLPVLLVPGAKGAEQRPTA